MKKILFLLLATISTYAQVDTGLEQEFDYGIKNNSAPIVPAPNYLTTSSATGVYGKIEPINLQISTATQNALDVKQIVFTGIDQAQFLTENDIVIDNTALTLTIATVKNGGVISSSNPVIFYTDGNGVAVRRVKNAPVVFTFTNTTGIWYFYFDSSGNPIASQTAPVDSSTIARIYRIYWNASLAIADKRVIESLEAYKNDATWIDRDWKDTQGAQYSSGFTLTSNVLASGTPAIDGSNAVVNLTSGTILDVNLAYTLTNASTGTAKFTQNLGSGLLPATSGKFITITNNASLILDKIPATDFPFLWNATTNTPEYLTQLGVRTGVSVNNFFVYYLYAIQDPRRGETIKIKSAEIDFANSSLAEAHSWTQLQTLFPTLRDSKIRVLYKLTFEYKTAFDIGTKKSALRKIEDLRKQRITSTATVGGVIPASTVSFTATGNISSTNVQLALEELDSEKENLANKATDFTTVNNTLYPTVQAVKTYADGLDAGNVKLVGNQSIANVKTFTDKVVISGTNHYLDLPSIDGLVAGAYLTPVVGNYQGYFAIAGSGGNSPAFKISTPNTNNPRLVNLPDADGTIALTSNLTPYAPLASPTFTGTPTAPTATAGTNTTQLATTAFVFANTQPLIPHLGFNNTKQTLWNYGKGGIATNNSFGNEALSVNTTGFDNSAYGLYALGTNTTGNGNVAFGNRAGNQSNSPDINGFQNQFSTNSVFIGNWTSSKDNNTANTNEIVIGDKTLGAGSNTATLGNTSITTTRLRGSVLGGSFVKDGGLSTQFLKADGSSDGTAYATSTGGTGYIQNQNISAQTANMWINGDIKSRQISLNDGFGVNVGGFQTGGVSSDRFYIYNNTLGLDNFKIIQSTGAATFSSTVTAPTFIGALTGNAISATNWGDSPADFSNFPTNMASMLGYDNTASKMMSFSQAQSRTFLGLGSNAYTSTAYLPLTGGTLSGQLNISGTNAGSSIDIINTTATTGKNMRIVSLNAGGLTIEDITAGLERVNVSSAGVVKINNLSGTGTRAVVADASGNLSTESISTKTANYTTTLSDGTILVDATAGNITITLLTASGNSDKKFTVKKIDSTANTVTVSNAAGIDGTTTKVYSTQYSGGSFQSNGTKYFIIGNF